jgi:hypothetical protein
LLVSTAMNNQTSRDMDCIQSHFPQHMVDKKYV